MQANEVLVEVPESILMTTRSASQGGLGNLFAEYYSP